jgi:serine/threonine protein kinase
LNDQQDHDEKLASLLIRWEEAWDLGEELSPVDLCADCPDLIPPLEDRIRALKQMAWMKTDAGQGNDQENETPDVLLGQTLAGRYHIERLIGEGGFSRVYRAFDPELDRHVAVKVSRPGRMASEKQSDDLLEEARRAARLRHPGIVSVHDVGRHDGQVFFVTDLIEGHSLAEMVAESQFSPLDAVRLIAEVADALQFAHEQGFIHRDIKPANILIDHQSRSLIADFGIATPVEQIAEESGEASGTLAYMAPEQVANERQLIDPRTDIHALGVVLYELLTGQLPYQGRTPMALREQILFRQPKPPTSFNPSVPKLLEQNCLRALTKHPADRFSSAEEFAAALRACSASEKKCWTWPIIVGVLGVMGIAVSLFGSNIITALQARSADKPVIPFGAFTFDGTNRIITPVEQFAPVTLEAWIRPDRYEYRCHFIIGSDVPAKYGIGLGICGVLLTGEYIPGKADPEFGTTPGMIRSAQMVPIKEWSHIAAVFGETETRLYFNGKLVKTGPPTAVNGGTNFVIGNVGKDNPIDYFLGQIRSVRISRGERFSEDFEPEPQFVKDAEDAPNRAILFYDGSKAERDRVIDLTGNGNDGHWQRMSE